jgi:ribosomal protein S18 acetylase RimI-like enzyme
MWIHHATPADADRLSQLACNTYRAHFAAIWRPERLAAYLRSEFGVGTLERALAAQDQAWYLLGSAEDTLLGYAKVNWRRSEPLSGRTGAHLQKIYFRPDQTGHGFGTTLLAHVLAAARARGEPWIWLQVLDINARAQRFYLRHGFVALGSAPFAADTGTIAMHTLGRELD